MDRQHVDSDGHGPSHFALVAFVNGFTSISTPLTSIQPQGVAGCSLLVSPDYERYSAR